MVLLDSVFDCSDMVAATIGGERDLRMYFPVALW